MVLDIKGGKVSILHTLQHIAGVTVIHGVLGVGIRKSGIVGGILRALDGRQQEGKSQYQLHLCRITVNTQREGRCKRYGDLSFSVMRDNFLYGSVRTFMIEGRHLAIRE